jgi:hypothetical protein
MDSPEQILSDEIESINIGFEGSGITFTGLVAVEVQPAEFLLTITIFPLVLPIVALKANHPLPLVPFGEVYVGKEVLWVVFPIP